MDPIIAGRFQTIAKADATAVLLTEYINASDICIFYNNPPGQHDVLPAGGDEKIDPASEDAHGSAVAAGATAGVAAGAVGAFGGPIVSLAAAGIAAYTGSLAGAMHGTKNEDEVPDPPRRHAGVILAVHVVSSDNEARIVSTLKQEGAEDIEHAHGEWRNGDWADFNPLETPVLDEND